MMNWLKVSLALTMLILAPAPALAWDDDGHLVIAQVALSRLGRGQDAGGDPHVLLLLEGAVQSLNTEVVDEDDRYTTLTLGSYMDDLRGDPFYDYLRPWHYIDMPSLAPGYTPADPDQTKFNPNRANLLTQINTVAAKLREGGLTKQEEAQQLAFLIHMVGDAHQPMHCVTRYSEAFPRGDAGGNRYPIKGDKKNLHAYWDAAGLLYATTDIDRPLSRSNLRNLEQLALDAMSAYPATEEGWKELKAEAWVEESHTIAADFAYTTPAGEEPKGSYKKETQRLCRIQIAKAGYRLAALLSEIYSAKPPAQKGRAGRP